MNKTTKTYVQPRSNFPNGSIFNGSSAQKDFTRHPHLSVVNSNKTNGVSNVTRSYNPVGSQNQKNLVNERGEILVPKGKQVGIEECKDTGKKKSKILNIQVLGNPIPAIRKKFY